MHVHHSDIIGDVSVLRDLHHREVRGKNGTPRKRILFALGGGRAGLITAERLHVFQEAGIPADHFDLIVGISAGSFNALAYSSKQTTMLREMYYYLSALPVYDPVHQLICEVCNRFDREAFEASKPEILIGVSNDMGKLRLESAKNSLNLFGLLYAGASIPPFSSAKMPEGSAGYDGAFAHPCPVGETIRKMQRTWEPGVEVDIILMSNRPRSEHVPLTDLFMSWWGVNVFLKMWMPLLCNGANAIDAKVAAVIPMFEKKRRNSRFRTCAWFPRSSEYLFPLEWSTFTLERVAGAVRAETERVLESVRPTASV